LWQSPSRGQPFGWELAQTDCVLVAIVRNEARLEPGLSQILQILNVNVFELCHWLIG
jgi:hypothetical protein